MSRRDRVNSENNVFRFNLQTSELVDKVEKQVKPNNRKYSMNNDQILHPSDLIGSPIKESIKEHFNEDEEEEVKEELVQPLMEKHRTFEPKHLD